MASDANWRNRFQNDCSDIWAGFMRRDRVIKELHECMPVIIAPSLSLLPLPFPLPLPLPLPLSIYLSISLSDLSVCLSACLPVGLSACLSISIYLSI